MVANGAINGGDLSEIRFQNGAHVPSGDCPRYPRHVAEIRGKPSESERAHVRNLIAGRDPPGLG